MLKRITTILLLFALGGAPVAAQGYQLSVQIYDAIEQLNDEEGMSCCLSGGECSMKQHQPMIVQPATNCVNDCLCAAEPASATSTVLVTSPQLAQLIAAPVTLARPPSVSAIISIQPVYQIIPVHKSQNTYLRTAKFRL